MYFCQSFFDIMKPISFFIFLLIGGQIFSQNKIKAFAELYHHTQNQYYKSLLVTFEDKKLKIDGFDYQTGEKEG